MKLLRRMRFKIIYALFIIAALLYGDLILGPISIRQLMTIVMFVACCTEDKKLYSDKYLQLYIVFCIFFGISSLITGHIIDYLHDIIAYSLVAYTGYWATVLIKKKYDALNIFVVVVVVVGCIDALATVSQATYMNFMDPYLQIFHLGVRVDDFLLKQELGRDLTEVTIPGILSSSVFNGHFLCLAAVLSLALQKSKFNIFGCLATLLIFIGLVFCQQRAPFFFGVLLCIFILYKNLFENKSYTVKLFLILIVASILMLLIPIIVDLFSFADSRYAKGISDENRVSIFKNSIDWIIRHPLGGIYELQRIRPPHNFFLNAWAYAGWLGGTIMILTLILQLKKILPIVFRKYDKGLLIYFAVAYIGLVGNSMVHNVSIVTGDFLSWMTWAAVFIDSRWYRIPHRNNG